MKNNVLFGTIIMLNKQQRKFLATSLLPLDLL